MLYFLFIFRVLIFEEILDERLDLVSVFTALTKFIYMFEWYFSLIQVLFDKQCVGCVLNKNSAQEERLFSTDTLWNRTI